MVSINDLLNNLRRASTKDYPQILESITKEVMKDDFKEIMKKEPFSNIVELIIVLPEQNFEEFLNKYMDILRQKISEGAPECFGRLYEGLSKPKRKILSKALRGDISKRLSSFKLEDIIKMLYNVIPATREIVLNQYKEIMMQPKFSKIILDTPIETLAEFLSLAPESIRRALIKRHKETLTSDEFLEKLRTTDPDTRAQLLRWLPMDLSKEIVSKISS